MDQPCELHGPVHEAVVVEEFGSVGRGEVWQTLPEAVFVPPTHWTRWAPDRAIAQDGHGAAVGAGEQDGDAAL
eukprot:8813852-Lingulodinium_polyedra.AAC.2